MKKKHILCAAAALVCWLVTFYTDTKIFTGEPLNMNCLPIDTRMAPVMHLLTKCLVLLVLFGIAEFLTYAWRHKKTLLLPFGVFFLVYGIGLLITYPGYFMSDDPILFGYATRYYPVYWHHYLTSLYYMVGMSLLPASAGPVFLNDLSYALVYAYIFHRGCERYQTKGKWVLALLACMPATLLGALMCFRPALYAPFFVLYFAVLFFDYKGHAALGRGKLFLLLLLTVVLCQWRSEGLVLVVFAPFLLCIAYRKSPFEKQNGKRRLNRKRTGRMLAGAGVFLVLYIVINLPQSIGMDTYYGSDYLIISTTRPLSVIVHREQTYEGAEEDLANISAVTEYGYLHNDSLSCSAYNRYNTDHNGGRYTQTGTDAQTQKAYLRSAARLLLHNLDLYFGERVQLFLVTNGFFYYPGELVLNLKPVVATDFHLYEHDRDYGFEMLEAYKRVPLYADETYAMFLFDFGGEAYIPCLLLALVFLTGSLIKRKWLWTTALLSLFARETVIFLSAPASFIQYSYPMMFATLFLAMLALLEWLDERRLRSFTFDMSRYILFRTETDEPEG